MSPDSRARSYRDPLDLIWLNLAATLGWQVERDDEVFASWDGKRTLRLCTSAAFDPDDSLAQMIFHEVCHALVQGRRNRRRTDWGLGNEHPDTDAVAEHACHRLQAALAQRWGLRDLLAVTTDWRPYWDALPLHALAPGDDPAIVPARAAWPEALRGPWSVPLTYALSQTAALAAVMRPIAPSDSLWSSTVPLHDHVPYAAPATDHSCSTCAWFDPHTAQCQHAKHTTTADARACLHHEPLPNLDCLTCAACCRQGFHQVGLVADDAVHHLKPEWVLRDQHGSHLPRPNGRCVALEGTEGQAQPCAIYADRPAACRAFERAGEHCLAARQRVGLTPL